MNGNMLMHQVDGQTYSLWGELLDGDAAPAECEAEMLLGLLERKFDREQAEADIKERLRLYVEAFGGDGKRK